MAIPAAVFRPSFSLSYESLRQVLSHHGYTEAGVVALIDGNDLDLDQPVVLRRASGTEPFSSLSRLFLLGEQLGVPAAAELFAPLDLSSLVRCGLLQCDGQRVTAAAKLVPSHDLLVLSDFSPTQRGGELRRDHVLGVGAATTTLTALTPGRIFRSALDLGTGCGVQALRAARHCSRVIATDVNPRALNFAAMNARLNDVANIEFREGSFFQPLRGMTFDLIISNPPFVISPEQRFIFSDGDGSNGDVSEHVVRNAPAFLNDDGIAVVLINWHHSSEDDWSARPLQWCENNGCDCWLLKFRSADPLTYAADWLRPLERRDAAAYGARLDGWLAYYRETGIRRLSAGAVILQKRPAKHNWRRCDAVPFGHHAGHCGGQVERIVAAETFLDGLPNERELLGCRLRFHADHQLNANLTCAPEGWGWRSLELRPAPGMSFVGTVDTVIMEILGKCDGTETLDNVLHATASSFGLELSEIIQPSLRVMHKLLRAGFLVVEHLARPEAGLVGEPSTVAGHVS